MFRGPPSTQRTHTPFPYTTLFRSHHVESEISRRFRRELVTHVRVHRSRCAGNKHCCMGRRGFSKEIATDRDKAAGPRIRQRKHAFRFGARIEATRNPPPLPHAIATDIHRGAAPSRGQGPLTPRSYGPGTDAGNNNSSVPAPTR